MQNAHVFLCAVASTSAPPLLGLFSDTRQERYAGFVLTVNASSFIGPVCDDYWGMKEV